jgi:HEAT repeat protein
MGEIAVEPLISILKSSEGGVRRYATLALKDIGSASVSNQLIESLKDDDWSVRKFASKALGEMKNTEAIDPLIATLDDEDWGVKIAAVKALGDIGNSKAVDPIKKARRNARGDKEFKKAANKALKKIQKK